MTAALSLPLQRALFAHLSADAGLVAALGGPRIYDAPPHADGPAADPGPYLLLGDETIAPWFDQSGAGADHALRFRVISFAAGFAEAKAIAAALSDALDAPPPALSRGRIVRIQFLGAEARRGGASGGGAGLVARRIDLRFRVIVEDDAA
ncbi:MAG: DUF3168 domain-containing protein [Pseudomonadota bacterium]